MQQDPRCKQLDIMSFLVKPVQRVCKYPLLLRVCYLFKLALIQSMINCN